MAKLCEICNLNKSIIKRPKTKQSICKSCFFMVFEEEVHKTITENNLFKRGDRVAIGASGGKDSTVLAHIMKTLNERYDYGLELFLLSIDEGISGYRDDSLETVKRNKDQYNMELVVLSYKDLYGWSMDEIVEAVGRKNNCANQIITGHNADDIAETVLMNILRGDVARLARCTEIISNSDDLVSRSKPFKYTYEKEIVMYAYLNKLDYFATECTYSPNAYRGYARVFLKDLEAVRPSAILDIIYSGELLTIKNKVKMPTQSTCKRCGYMSSNDLCKACVLLQGLNSGLSAKSIGKNSHSLSSNGTENSNQIDSNTDTASRLSKLSIDDKNDLTVHFDVLRSGLENIRKSQKNTEKCNSGIPCTSCPNNS
ncbi:Cytoplasmic tRNA 2-thiolation protein 1 [Smittium culicis]|uniref:Cytoplasmic tRNA 2-thiolation protein 1 n=1 Tax=Smittium culicis TaxID=133412 RepID=A0A1R1YI53_9FUNG|nr:Cytoplasmic tRNA 2-thiolation protein 1 [Smittium culicis]